jgi:hypothetical protein
MRSIAVTAFGILLCLPTAAQAELRVNISKAQQRLAIVVDGAEVYRWPISSGRRGYQTPAGVFRPIRLERHWYSRRYDWSPMPWSVFFYRGYAVHGTTEAHSLGRPASHGCVRLRPDNAAILYSLVRRHGYRNTRLVVMDGPLPASPGAIPMAENEQPRAPEPVAEAAQDGEEHLSAKAHDAPSVQGDEEARDPRKPARVRTASAAYRVSVSHDEAQVLRERAAWLRGLDRKYGIAR